VARRVDAKRDRLIVDIEEQLAQRHHVETLFAVRWTVT